MDKVGRAEEGRDGGQGGWGRGGKGRWTRWVESKRIGEHSPLLIQTWISIHISSCK